MECTTTLGVPAKSHASTPQIKPALLQKSMRVQTPADKMSNILLESDLEKWVGNAWKSRRAILTSDSLHFMARRAQGQEDVCTDTIMLEDIAVLNEKRFDIRTGIVLSVSIPSYPPAAPAQEEFDSIKSRMGSSSEAAERKGALLSRSGSRLLKRESSEAGHRHIIYFETVASDKHCARKYFIHTRSEDYDRWNVMLEESLLQLRLKAQRNHKLLAYQMKSKNILKMRIVRLFFSSCILLSFVSDALEMQLIPEGRQSSTGTKFFIIELMCTIVFTIELAWNMSTYWFWDFFSDGWCLLDVIVVVASIVSLSTAELGGTNFKSVRMVRVFRALRVVSQFQSLRKVVNALTSAIFPVVSAMFVAVIVIAVYAIIGVSMYSDESPELFGDFGRAVWTLVTAATLESWVDYSLTLMGGDPKNLNAAVIVYFVTYIVIVAYVLTSVIVAVLLENFTEASQSEHQMKDEEEQSEGLKSHLKDNVFALDPLLSVLVQVDTIDELNMHVDSIFEVLDVEGSGEISFEDMQLGLQTMDFSPRIQIDYDDYLTFTQQGRLIVLDNDKMLLSTFRQIIHRQLRDFISRQIGRQSLIPQNQRSLSSLFYAVNYLLITQHTSESRCLPQHPASHGIGRAASSSRSVDGSSYTSVEQVNHTIGDECKVDGDTRIPDLSRQIQLLNARMEQIDVKIDGQFENLKKFCLSLVHDRPTVSLDGRAVSEAVSDAPARPIRQVDLQVLGAGRHTSNKRSTAPIADSHKAHESSDATSESHNDPLVLAESEHEKQLDGASQASYHSPDKHNGPMSTAEEIGEGFIPRGIQSIHISQSPGHLRYSGQPCLRPHTFVANQQSEIVRARLESTVMSAPQIQLQRRLSDGWA